jgi:ribosomal protein S18 acetylase RimI-like enzyme
MTEFPTMPPSVQFRAYSSSDLDHLYQICLQTADGGRDASKLYADGRLPGLFYAAPYVMFDPSLCLVACLDQTPCGYVLGTSDSRAFEHWCEANWFPPLRARYPLPPVDDASADAKLIRLIHRGYRVEANLEAYPGHLHIDLLPCIQRQGAGTKLIKDFIALLAGRNCPALHLGVNAANEGACKFYESIGLSLVRQSPHVRTYGLVLSNETRPPEPW